MSKKTNAKVEIVALEERSYNNCEGCIGFIGKNKDCNLQNIVKELGLVDCEDGYIYQLFAKTNQTKTK